MVLVGFHGILPLQTLFLGRDSQGGDQVVFVVLMGKLQPGDRTQMCNYRGRGPVEELFALLTHIATIDDDLPGPDRSDCERVAEDERGLMEYIPVFNRMSVRLNTPWFSKTIF